MNKKIFQSVFLTSSILSILVGVILTCALYSYYRTEQMNALKNETAYIARGIEEDPDNYLKNLNTPERVTVVSPDGTVLQDTYEDPSLLENHLDREEIAQALKTGSGEAIRHSDTISERTLNYAVKIKNGDVVRVSIQVASLFSIFTGLIQLMVGVIVASLIISYLVAKTISKRLLKPIQEIDLNHPLSTPSYPELSPLVRRIEHQNQEIEKRIQQARQFQSDFETIIDSMAEGIIVLNPKGEIVSYNQAVLNLFGAAAPAQGSHALVLNRSRIYRDLVKTVLSGQSGEGELRIRNQVIEIIASPVFSKEDEKTVSGAVLILLDVTEKVSRDKLRAEYISNVSHELKTPLTSISGYAEIMKDGMVEDKMVSEFSGKIYGEAQHMIAMVEDILDIAKLEERPEEYAREKVNLLELIREIREHLSVKIKQKQIQIDLTSEGDPILTGSPDVLYDILKNLLDNAVKYNHQGGSVQVTLNGTEKQVLVVTVEDSGIGIAPDERERVFERFYRADLAHSRRVEGTGLGLSIVKHGVNLHHGEISMHSQLDEGTTIQIVFPR